MCDTWHKKKSGNECWRELFLIELHSRVTILSTTNDRVLKGYYKDCLTFVCFCQPVKLQFISMSVQTHIIFLAKTFKNLSVISLYMFTYLANKADSDRTQVVVMSTQCLRYRCCCKEATVFKTWILHTHRYLIYTVKAWQLSLVWPLQYPTTWELWSQFLHLFLSYVVE